MNSRPFKTKDWPVLRVEKGGFRVLGGFRFSWYDNKGGVIVDWLGWRLNAGWMRPRSSVTLFLASFWDELPRYIQFWFGPLDIHFSPAYSGMPVLEEDDGL